MINDVTLSLFQFHKGTIKTNNFERPAVDVKTFQFHKGTIKTNSAAFVRMRQHDFNSIKVRLKQLFPHHNKHIIGFQFHKGTIKTPNSLIPRLCIGYFNSIKVRLKLSEQMYQQRQFDNFNSIKVRLKPTQQTIK